jgi:hypothetical protein
MALCAATVGIPVFGAQTFRVFDALGQNGKPNLGHTGMLPIAPIYRVWSKGASHDVLDEPALLAEVDGLAADTQYAYIDIEAWPFLGVPTSTRDASIAKLARAAELVRARRPTLQIGIFGSPPAGTYWPLVRSDPAGYTEWLAANRAMAPLAEKVDFIFPCLYTVYADRHDWLTFAGATLKEARQYAKPVYPFVWFEYHDSNWLLRGREIDNAAWEEELLFIKSQADGLVIWGGVGEHWSESARWWQSAVRLLDLRRTSVA